MFFILSYFLFFNMILEFIQRKIMSAFPVDPLLSSGEKKFGKPFFNSSLAFYSSFNFSYTLSTNLTISPMLLHLQSRMEVISTRLGLWLFWKKRRWPNAHRTTLTTLCLLLLKRTILSTLLLLAPIETNKTPPAVAADAVAQAIIVVEELAIVAKADDHNIIKMGHGISRGHILLGFPSGSHEPFLLALILPLEIRTNQSLQTVNPTFLGREHSRHTWLHHNHHTHQHTFKLQCRLYLWLLLTSSGTWTQEPHLT